MRGLGEFQRNQMKHRDARIHALCQHLRSAVDILEDIASNPFAPPEKPTAPQPFAPPPAPTVALAPDRLIYTQKEVAAALGVARTTIWRYVRAGHLPAIRMGDRNVIPAEGLRAWLAALPSARPQAEK